LIDDKFIPIPDFVSRFEYFTTIYKPSEFHPEHAPDEADEYEQWRKSVVAKSVNVQFVKPSAHGMAYKVAPVYSNTTKPLYRPTLKLEFQGKFVAAAVRYPSDRKYSRAKRGKVTGFSAGSRTRMFDMFHKLEIKVKPIFLTLTYGEDYPDAQTAKKNLRALFERIRRLFKSQNVSAIWRMEFQERGAPHFHIIFFGLPYIRKEKIQEWWGAIIGFEKPFTRIEQIKSHRGVMSYVSKYCAKVPESEILGEIQGCAPYDDIYALEQIKALSDEYKDKTIGRQWGKVNKPDESPYTQVTLSEQEQATMRIVLSGFAEKWNQKYADKIRSKPDYVSYQVYGMKGLLLAYFWDKIFPPHKHPVGFSPFI